MNDWGEGIGLFVLLYNIVYSVYESYSSFHNCRTNSVHRGKLGIGNSQDIHCPEAMSFVRQERNVLGKVGTVEGQT